MSRGQCMAFVLLRVARTYLRGMRRSNCSAPGNKHFGQEENCLRNSSALTGKAISFISSFANTSESDRPVSNDLTTGDESHIDHRSSGVIRPPIHERSVGAPVNSTSTPPRSNRDRKSTRL